VIIAIRNSESAVGSLSVTIVLEDESFLARFFAEKNKADWNREEGRDP
jgi:hypothetical protein